jgi:trans-aconitate methyltransferase
MQATYKLISGILKKLGAKAQAWDMEFRTNEWDRPTKDDAVYPVLARYPGSVLDLGCGSGVMTTEIQIEYYTGVDISREAIRKARARNPHHDFYVSDIERFTPDYRYDVILFRESLYYARDQKGLLIRLRQYLNPLGVFIVRIHDRLKHRHTLNMINDNFRVLERILTGHGEIIIFQ